MNLATKAYNALMGKGRPSAMQAIAVRMLRDSATSLANDAYKFYRSIYEDLSTEAMREDAIIQWEKQFGITPASGDSPDNRREAIEAAWNTNGAQGAGYLQREIRKSIPYTESYNGEDITPLVVRNNIPAIDYVTDAQISLTDKDNPPTERGMSFTDLDDEIVFGAGYDGYLLGNGQIAKGDGTYYDPINIPVGGEASNNQFCNYTDCDTFTALDDVDFSGPTTGWSYIFVIEHPSGEIAQIPSQYRAKLESAILKLRPAHLGIFMRVIYT